MDIDDALEYGDSVFFESDARIEVKEKNSHSVLLFFIVAFPPLIVIVCLVYFAPHAAEESPVVYVILVIWFLLGMYAYLYKKNIVVDLLKKEFMYKTSVVGFPLGYICRPFSAVTEVKVFTKLDIESSRRNQTGLYILVFVVGKREYEINATSNKDACERQKDFFEELLKS